MPRPLLAAYACLPQASRGRVHPESISKVRDIFQRDRDRVIHCAAFRRLCYKTQVFITTDGDSFRTRLTHSLEVAQIGRSIARQLRLNEDLVEAIALAHDLGHTPFGHAGQHALNECMRPYGGFEHNLQSLRVVDVLEQRYAEFDGLNLSFETREGILKHCNRATARRLGELGARFLDGHQASLEAQIVDLADEIAYSNHDVDDGLRSGLIGLEQLQASSLFARHFEQTRERFPQLGKARTIASCIREMIGALVQDLVVTSRGHLEATRPASMQEVREASQALIAHSQETMRELTALKRILRRELYRHPRVLGEMSRGQAIIHDLFKRFQATPQSLPPDYFARYTQIGERAIADYIAGMTDRFAIKIGTGSI